MSNHLIGFRCKLEFSCVDLFTFVEVDAHIGAFRRDEAVLLNCDVVRAGAVEAQACPPGLISQSAVSEGAIACDRESGFDRLSCSRVLNDDLDCRPRDEGNSLCPGRRGRRQTRSERERAERAVSAFGATDLP